MQRREFITLLGGVAAWPVAARAQPPATQSRIAIFHPAIPTTHLTETGGGSAWRAFFAELRRLGYVEGENLIIERYSAEGHHERYKSRWVRACVEPRTTARERNRIYNPRAAVRRETAGASFASSPSALAARRTLKSEQPRHRILFRNGRESRPGIANIAGSRGGGAPR